MLRSASTRRVSAPTGCIPTKAATRRSPTRSKNWEFRTRKLELVSRRSWVRTSTPGPSSACRLFLVLYSWYLRLVEFFYALASERFELSEAGLALADQLRHVDAEGRRFELLESGGAVAQQAGGAAPVAVLQVVEADAHLQDALVEITDAPGLVHPGLFEILVALEELAPVEFLYAPEDEVRQFLGRFTGRPPGQRFV